jgi:hypothetical protein
MSLIRTKTPKSPKAESKKLVFSGKRLDGTWIMETQLPVPVRRSAMNASVVIADNRRVRTLH